MYVVYSVDVSGTSYYGVTTEAQLANADSKHKTYTAALRKLHSLDPEANPWDVDVACTSPVTTWLYNRVYNNKKPHEYYTAWATEDATNEIHRMFFWTGYLTNDFACNDVQDILQGETFVDVMCSFFYTLLVCPRNQVSHSVVYNSTNRKMVVRRSEKPYFEEMTPVAFGTETAPWVAQTLLQLCRLILAGSTNAKNRKMDMDAVKKRAAEILTMAYEEELVYPVLGSKKKQRKEIEKTLTQMIIEYSKDPVYINAIYEKRRRLYPTDHPQHPDLAKYKKKIDEQETIKHQQRYDVAKDQPILDMNLLKQAERNARSELKALDH
jgi:hypothetical protein